MANNDNWGIRPHPADGRPSLLMPPSPRRVRICLVGHKRRRLLLWVGDDARVWISCSECEVVGFTAGRGEDTRPEDTPGTIWALREATAEWVLDGRPNYWGEGGLVGRFRSTSGTSDQPDELDDLEDEIVALDGPSSTTTPANELSDLEALIARRVEEEVARRMREQAMGR